MNICPHCNQPILPNDPPGVALPPVLRRIYQLLHKYPLSPAALHERLYGQDPDGGPLAKTLTVHIHHLNKRLRPVGLQVKCIEHVYQLRKMVLEANAA
jgi:DNA-binding response OmpR family regulator